MPISHSPPRSNDYRSTMLERPTLTFCVEGLQAREELLFKALVRLLDHVTHQQWRYQPAAADTRVDLLVVAVGVQPTYTQRLGGSPQSVLQLGEAGHSRDGYLSWPLKPDALEKELNQLGGRAVRQRSPQAPVALFTGAATGTTIEPGAKGKLMRLQQWPPSRLLAGPGRMRLATLLTGKAMSLDELVHRSALPLPVCSGFVDELQRARLLVEPQRAAHTPANAPQPKPTQRSLLARIRVRLGIAV